MPRPRWLPVLAAGCLMTAWGSKALALTIGPSVVELRAPAGGEASGQFTVGNDTNGPILVIMETEPLTSKGYAPIEPSVWLSVRPSSVIVQAGESAQVAYAVRVPHEAAGELAAEVVFVQHIGMERGGVQVRMGMAVYAAVAGTERLAASIEQMALQTGKDGAHIQLRIANRGNVHCRPEGLVRLLSADGQVTAQGRLNRGMPIHPDAVGTFTVPINVPEPGAYQITADLACHGSADPVRLTAVQQGELNAAALWSPSNAAAASAHAPVVGR